MNSMACKSTHFTLTPKKVPQEEQRIEPYPKHSSHTSEGEKGELSKKGEKNACDV